MAVGIIACWSNTSVFCIFSTDYDEDGIGSSTDDDDAGL